MIKKTRKHLSHDEKIVEKRKQLAAKGKVAAIWTRVSSADQFKQNYSIDTQKLLVGNIANVIIYA